MTDANLSQAGVPMFACGNFITVAAQFAILGLMLFIVVRQIFAMKRAAPPPAPPAPTPEGALRLREIRDALRKWSRSGAASAARTGSSSALECRKDR